MMTSQKEAGEKERKKKVYKFECLEKKILSVELKAFFIIFQMLSFGEIYQK